MTNSQQIRAASLENYVEIARDLGLSSEDMLARAGLTLVEINDPDRLIPVESVRKLLQDSFVESNGQAVGLLLAKGRRFAHFGDLGLLSARSANVRAVLKTFEHFGHLHNQSLVYALRESEGMATVQLDLLLNNGHSISQSIELAIGVLFRVMALHLGDDWRPRQVCFTHVSPGNLQTHRAFFGITPRFSAEFNGLVCNAADLDRPVPYANPVVAAYIRQKLISQSASNRSLTDEVRQLCLILLPQGRCSIEQVARQIGVSRRTLHRGLQAECVTFSSLLLSIKSELALRYVRDSDMPLTEIAQLLGFSFLSAFSRWFRGRFQLSPDSFRAQRRSA